jgi:hypothetical protein
MADFKRTASILLSCFMPFFLTGCLMHLNSAPEPTSAFSPDLPPAQYAPAIEDLKARIRKPDDPSGTANAHLYLAWLYASHKNPEPDYTQALEQIDQYLASQTKTDDRYAARNLQSLLAALTAAEDGLTMSQALCASRNEQLKADLKRLTAEMQRLEAESKTLKDRADQLQTKAAQLELANQQLTQKNTVLENNNRELASYNKSLLEKNKEFEQTIERLKTLELQVERKRKSFK